MPQQKIHAGQIRTGVTAGDILVIDTGDKLPVIDGSQLTAVDAATLNTFAVGTTANDIVQLDANARLALVAFSETALSYGIAGGIQLDTSASTYYYPTGATIGIITFGFLNPAPTGQVTSFTLELSGAASFPPVWPAGVIWPNGTEPTWTVGIDVVSFITRDSGTTWLGMLGGTAFA